MAKSHTIRPLVMSADDLLDRIFLKTLEGNRFVRSRQAPGSRAESLGLS